MHIDHDTVITTFTEIADKEHMVVTSMDILLFIIRIVHQYIKQCKIKRLLSTKLLDTENNVSQIKHRHRSKIILDI